jgi:Mrp family chromosome partitioning ATPase
VILDTPPALATVEMAELAPHVDFVLVVVRHGRVTRRSLQTLSRQAEGWRAEIVGAVITDSPPESDEYYYYATK